MRRTTFRKSTIWLTQEEMLALDRLALQRGLTRSALIREGIWRVLRSHDEERPVRVVDWFRREEELVMALTNGGYSDDAIAQEVRAPVQRVAELRRSIQERWRRWDEEDGLEDPSAIVSES